MAAPRGPNPLSHLQNRQSGNNIINFRKLLFRERLSIAKNLYRKDLVSHFGCVNAIEFSNEGELLVSGGDDKRVLLWQLERSMAGAATPQAMGKQHQSNIFCLSFNNDNTKIFSGGNDDTVIVHDVKTSEAFDVFLHAKPVYGLSVDQTNDQIFATAGEDGRVLIFDLRQGTEVMALGKYRAPFHAVQFHPLDGNFIITANGKEGAGFWDLRHIKMPAIRYGGDEAAQSCMSVRFNTLGTQVLALRRRLPPILFNVCSQVPICQFYHPDYYNSCTMKSCCFAGDDDEYVLSGSDDFNLYVWRVFDADLERNNQWIDTYQMVLTGHRSIVNQVRYNSQKCIIASSGVEKVIKLWCPFDLEGWKGNLIEEGSGYDNPRDVFSHEEYVSLVNSSGQNMTHDYSHQNTFEDPRMMAFFDSLVQREIEGWVSNETSASDKSSQHSSDGSSRPTSPESSDSEPISNYVTSNVEPCRRRQITMKPRTIYANRIAYLIATKRNTLKRLALKGAAHTERRVKSSKLNNRNLKRNSTRITRKASGKRTGRMNNTRNRSRDDNSDSEVPTTKSSKRRIQQHLNTAFYRLFKRKHKTNLSASAAHRNETTNSSSDEETTTAAAGVPSTSRRKDTKTNSTNDMGKYHCSKTTASTVAVSSDDDDDDDEDDDDDVNDNSRPTTSNFSINLAVPSTSTGITATASFRVPPQPIDSDDDQSLENSPPTSPVNLIRVVPLPINGKHKVEEIVYSSGQEENDNDNNDEVEDNDDDDNDDGKDDGAENDNNVSNHNNDEGNRSYQRKRPRTMHNEYSSFSNSRLSSSSQDMYASSSDSLTSFYKNNKRKHSHGHNKSQSMNSISETEQNNATTTASSSSSSTAIDANNLRTPNNQCMASTSTSTTSSSSSNCIRNLPQFTPDSGIGTPGCSSAGSTQIKNGNNRHHHDGNNNTNGIKDNGTSTDTTSMKIFQQKIARIRRNYRHNFGDDSDSD